MFARENNIHRKIQEKTGYFNHLFQNKYLLFEFKISSEASSHFPWYNSLFFSLFSFFKSQIINDTQDLWVCGQYFSLFFNFLKHLSSRLLKTIVSFSWINEIFRNLHVRMAKELQFSNYQFEFQFIYNRKKGY